MPVIPGESYQRLLEQAIPVFNIQENSRERNISPILTLSVPRLRTVWNIEKILLIIPFMEWESEEKGETFITFEILANGIWIPIAKEKLKVPAGKAPEFSPKLELVGEPFSPIRILGGQSFAIRAKLPHEQVAVLKAFEVRMREPVTVVIQYEQIMQGGKGNGR
jgi:hypothetical protein